MEPTEHLQPSDTWMNISPPEGEEVSDSWMLDFPIGKMIVNLNDQPGTTGYENDEKAYALGTNADGVSINGEELKAQGFKTLNLSLMPNDKRDTQFVELKREGFNTFYYAVFQRGNKEVGSPLTPLSYWMKLSPDHGSASRDIMIKPTPEEIAQVKIKFTQGGES